MRAFFRGGPAVLVAVAMGCGPSGPPRGEILGGSADNADASGSSSSGSGGAGGGSAEDAAEDSPAEDAGPEDAPASAAIGGFTASGVIDDVVTGNPLPGVSMCLIQAPTVCTTSDAQGNYSLTGIAASGSGFTGSLSGYVTGVWPLTPGGNVSGWTINLRSTSRVVALVQSLNTTFTSTTGAIFFSATDGNGNPLQGISVSTRQYGAQGYFTSDGSGLSASLTATTADGEGYFFGVEPGSVSVTFNGAGVVCTRSGANGWPPAASGQTMQVLVAGGEITLARAVCQ